jgi:hypothetical protein
MGKTGLAVVILLTAIAIPSQATEKAQAAASVADFWMGKHKDDVVEILGPPEKSKRTAKGEVLIYLGPVKWMATATSPYGQTREAVDREGNLVSPGGGGIGAGQGYAVTSKMKIYLDRDGKVYKVKTGKSK